MADTGGDAPDPAGQVPVVVTATRRYMLRWLFGLPTTDAAVVITPVAGDDRSAGAGDVICWGSTAAKVVAAVDIDSHEMCLCETAAGWTCLEWVDRSVAVLTTAERSQAPAMRQRTIVGDDPVLAGRHQNGRLWIAWRAHTWVRHPDAGAVAAERIRAVERAQHLRGHSDR